MKKIIILITIVATFISCNKVQNVKKQTEQQNSSEVIDSICCDPPIVYLQPLNGFSLRQAEKVKKQLRNFDSNMFADVEICKNKNLGSNLLNEDKTRYRADKIINAFSNSNLMSGTIGLINNDISIPYKGKPDWGVLGFSWKGKYVGIASTYRLKNPNRDYWKVIVHEYIHAHFNYGHCPKDNPKCIMQDAKGRANFANKNDLCDYCKKHIYDHTAY